LSTAREALARLDLRIEREADRRKRRWLEVHRRHWWGEVTGDLDLVMSTMSNGPIRYTMDGHSFMAADPMMNEIRNRDDTRKMYETISSTGVPACRAD
jgi:hypothetical protein